MPSAAPLGTCRSPSVAQLLRLPLRSDELAVVRFELGLLFIHLARVRGHERAQCVVQLRSLLVQLAHFGRQRLDMGVLGDVVGCLPRLLAKVAQGAELLNVGLRHLGASGSARRQFGRAESSDRTSARRQRIRQARPRWSRATVPRRASCTGDCSRHGSVDPWGQSHTGVPYACLPCRPPAVAVSGKILAIWGAERRGPGAK